MLPLGFWQNETQFLRKSPGINKVDIRIHLPSSAFVEGREYANIKMCQYAKLEKILHFVGRYYGQIER